MSQARVERLVRIAIAFVLVLLIAIAGFGKAVQELWNHLMPEIFGLPALGFWQAVGLMALSWILFGGLRGFGMMGASTRHRSWHRSCRDEAEELTPEERERVRRGFEQRCGGVGEGD